MTRKTIAGEWTLSDARAKSAHPGATVCGLLIALFGMPLFVVVYRLATGENRSDSQVILREAVIFAVVALLLWLVKTREALPLTSIGLQFDRPGRSVLRGCALALVMLFVTVGLYVLFQQFGFQLGKDTAFRPSLWVVIIIVLRAGIAEEIFYRGYAIERLRALTGNIWVAGLVPLVVFAAAHYRQGPAGIVAVFVLGGVATLFYLKFRDLIANMIGHGLADFVLNVILR
jgi:CAAX protease family protein